MRKYRRITFHDTEEWCKVWRKTDFLFQKRHEECGKFSNNHSKVQKFNFDLLFLSNVNEIWAKEIQRSYLSWQWTGMQISHKSRPSGFKNNMRNWVNFPCSTQSLKNCSLMRYFCPRHTMFQLKHFGRTMCHDTDRWCKI